MLSESQKKLKEVPQILLDPESSSSTSKWANSHNLNEPSAAVPHI